jgi:hypothetical protein
MVLVLFLQVSSHPYGLYEYAPYAFSLPETLTSFSVT